MLETQETTKLLNANGGIILDNISEQQLIDYEYLNSQVLNVDVSQDTEFQERFENLYHFNQYRIKTAIRAKVFEVMEAVKTSEVLDPRQLALLIFESEKLKNYRLRQFVVVSAIMHTLNSEVPIYAKQIVSFFEFDDPGLKQISNYRQLSLFIDLHNTQLRMYRELSEKEALQDLLKVVRIKFSKHRDILTPIKRMDLLIRSAGELKQKGKLIKSTTPSVYS